MYSRVTGKHEATVIPGRTYTRKMFAHQATWSLGCQLLPLRTLPWYLLRSSMPSSFADHLQKSMGSRVPHEDDQLHKVHLRTMHKDSELHCLQNGSRTKNMHLPSLPHGSRTTGKDLQL